MHGTKLTLKFLNRRNISEYGGAVETAAGGGDRPGVRKITMNGGGMERI